MAATKTRTAAKADRWVVCDDYAAGPYTPGAAPVVKTRSDAAPACADHAHRIVASATKPVTAAELRTMYAEWDAPVLDLSDDAHADRCALTRELAAAILAAPIRTSVGDLTINTAGWSKETGERADAAADSRTNPEAWIAALGAHEHATLTSDGKAAIRTAWCRCPGSADVAGWVRYEAWTAEGRIAHGFVCGTCRKLTQSG